MNLSLRNHSILTFVLIFICAQVVFADDNTVYWKPVSPAELAMKTPQVEADADAEAIFWEVTLDDKKTKKMFYNHYVRVKIFTERGRERFSKFDIPFTKDRKVEDVAARVIRPDGTTVELKAGDIFEREILKAGKLRLLAKSFAVPGIEPGVIVEYQFKEILKNDSADGEQFIFQRDIPMQRVTYNVRPYKGTLLKFDSHNMPVLSFVKGRDDFWTGTMTNVPALKEEPKMPPADEVRRWISLTYISGMNGYFSWSEFGLRMGLGFQEAIKPSSEILEKAEELTAGVEDDEEKIKRIYEFCRKQIRNLSFDTSVTDEQRENLRIKTAADVLRMRMGTAFHINLLFASLVKSAGFEANLAFSGNRSENFFDPKRDMRLSYIHPAGVGVLIFDWHFYNPGIPFLPFGMVNWFEEKTQTLLIKENGRYIWRETPLSDYKKSSAKRTGTFKLLEDGTLEGSVRLEYDGHQAIIRRASEFRNSPAKREENIKDEIKRNISTAEISALRIENFEDADKPLVFSYNVRIPNYAQKTGKRLFFQPGFFEYGESPLFSGDTRKHSIYFEYPWSESDSVEIQLPKTFALDSGDTPADIADTGKIASLNIIMGVVRDENVLRYHRNFYFGGGGQLLFPATTYQPLKNLFDAFHKANSHTISLRQK